jgi:Family of unknown function (DUF6375)
MKIWNTYGSEHSANLVMIGKFKDVASAETAKAIFDEISGVVVDSNEFYEDAEGYSETGMAC